MGRRRLLLIAAAALLSLGTVSSPAAAASGCQVEAIGGGHCVSTGIGPESVDLGAGSTTGGSDNGHDEQEPGEGARGGDSNAPSDGSERDPRDITDMLGTCQDRDRCGRPGTSTITLSDLASFSPTAPSIVMEPDGFFLRGLPANFVAASTANEHDGTLLERPVSVRFSPSTYLWEWGDGSSDTVSTAGSTWEDLGVPRFTATDTSHVFEERGPTTVALSVSYSVEVSVEGGEWIHVAGTVAATTTVDGYVGTAKTVLVDGDCTEDPSGPGC
jgi:hypothetical protein